MSEQEGWHVRAKTKKEVQCTPKMESHACAEKVVERIEESTQGG